MSFFQLLIIPAVGIIMAFSGGHVQASPHTEKDATEKRIQQIFRTPAQAMAEWIDQKMNLGLSEGICGNGKVYQTCGTACPKTCSNFRQKLFCTKQCVAGCFCPRNRVEHNGACIVPAQCPNKVDLIFLKKLIDQLED